MSRQDPYCGIISIISNLFGISLLSVPKLSSRIRQEATFVAIRLGMKLENLKARCF